MFYKVETHMHTSEVSTCAPDSAEKLVRGFIAAGYDAVIVTDHNADARRDMQGKPWEEIVRLQAKGYQAALRAAEGSPLKVFFAIELSLPRGEDYLVYGITPEQLLAQPELRGISLEDLSCLCRDRGYLLVRAHPFRHASYIPPNPTIRADLVDAVEVVNGRWDDPDNENPDVFAWAREHPRLHRTCGTDIHEARFCGTAGVALREPMRSVAQFMAAVRADEHCLIIDGRVCDLEGNIVED